MVTTFSVKLSHLGPAMQNQTEQSTLVKKEVTMLDERAVLLEEVNFKWLMAGLGWWVNMSLFNSDTAYASRYLKLAKASESIELRNCAAILELKNSMH
jgi:hypothetical protein